MPLSLPLDIPAILGGTPVRTAPWPTYDRGDVWICVQDEAAAIEAIRRRLYFRYDHRPFSQTYTGRFEARLTEFFGVPYALACSSGTAAITLGLLALGLEPGAEVACPAFTFAATPSAIMLAGARPVLVECDDNLRLDLRDLRRVLSAGAAAVVTVHMRGCVEDMPAVCGLAREFGVPVVEDAVPALGAKLYGRYAGTFGVAGAFSTQSDKSLNTGEGGFLLTRDETLFARAVVFSGAYEGRMSRHFPDGKAPVDDLAYPILGMRMDEIRAALAGSLMDQLPDRLAAHRRNYHRVVAGLDSVAEITGIRVRRPVTPDACLGEALLFRVPGATAAQTSWVARALRAEGIGARALADPDDANVRAFWNWRFLVGHDRRAARARLPRTAAYLDEVVDIPLSANLTETDCDQLIAAVTKVLPAMPEPMTRPMTGR